MDKEDGNVLMSIMELMDGYNEEIEWKSGLSGNPVEPAI